MQAFARFIMRGRLQAIGVSAAATLLSLVLPPLNYVSSAVIALVTLRRGWHDGLAVMAGTAAALAVFVGLSHTNPLPAVLLAGVVWVPVWLLSLVLRQTVSLSAMISTAALMGGAAVIGVYLALDDPAQFWHGLLNRLIDEIRRQNENSAADALGQVLTNAAPHLTGVAVAALMLGLILSVFLGRWWQALLYNPGGFRREFHGLRLGRHFAVATLVIMVVTAVGGEWPAEVAANVLTVAATAYLLHGLGLLHGVVAGRHINVAWLIGVYALTFLWPPSTLLLGAAGFVDSWMDIRARLHKGGAGG
jgi:hypothetical protein